MGFAQSRHVYSKKDLYSNNIMKETSLYYVFILIICCRTNSREYYVDIIGNHGDNLIALLHDVDLHILNPSRNLIDKLYVQYNY